MLRRRWPKIHTVEVDWRSNNKATWASVPKGALILPELDDGEHEGPKAAAEVASIMYAKCWEHLRADEGDSKMLYYSLSAWSLSDDGGLSHLETVTVGGGLVKDGTVAIADDDDASDGERRRAKEDQHQIVVGKLVDIIIKLAGKYPALLDSVEGVVSSSIKARSELATAEHAIRKDEIDAEVSKVETQEAAMAFRDLLKEAGPAFKIWAQSEYMKAQAAKGQAASPRTPHKVEAVELGRLLLDQLDGPTVSLISTVLEAEHVGDVLVVLSNVLDDEVKLDELRGQWLAVVPPLMAGQAKMGEVLGDEKSKALGASLLAFHMAITKES